MVAMSSLLSTPSADEALIMLCKSWSTLQFCLCPIYMLHSGLSLLTVFLLCLLQIILAAFLVVRLIDAVVTVVLDYLLIRLTRFPCALCQSQNLCTPHFPNVNPQPLPFFRRLATLYISAFLLIVGLIVSDVLLKFHHMIFCKDFVTKVTTTVNNCRFKPSK